MIGLSYKQKCNNFGYHSSEVQSKGNDREGVKKTSNLRYVINEWSLKLTSFLILLTIWKTAVLYYLPKI